MRTSIRQLSLVSVVLLLGIAATPSPASSVVFWGELGHRLTAQAAVDALPAEMPAFFRDARAQLAYLNPEPDRWRQGIETSRDAALDGSNLPDHYIDLELIPERARTAILGAKDRHAYADSLRAHGVSAATTGFLPFRILELTQRLRTSFRLWRRAPNAQVREWIEARIINDAGTLGHYVSDGANPAHTTIHFNGWVGANPNGFATDSRLHSRFESAYVQNHIALGDVSAQVEHRATLHTDLRPAVLPYLAATHSQVVRLYEIDKAAPFGTETTAPENKLFVAARLGAGATMLRDLWWSAYVGSATAAPGDDE